MPARPSWPSWCANCADRSQALPPARPCAERRRPAKSRPKAAFFVRWKKDYFFTAEAAASTALAAASLAASAVAVAAPATAEAAASAAPATAEAAAEAASATGAGAGAGAAAGAGAGAGASSFLPQAARATAATRVANRSDLFISVSSGVMGRMLGSETFESAWGASWTVAAQSID